MSAALENMLVKARVKADALIKDAPIQRQADQSYFM